jgi:hypothetical protein
MKSDIQEYICSCKTCQKRQCHSGEAPLEPITKHPIPFFQVGIDVMGPLPKTLTGFCYVVIAIDHFTKWVEARYRGRILVWALLVTCVRDRVLFCCDAFLKFRHLAVVSHKFARVAAKSGFPPFERSSS